MNLTNLLDKLTRLSASFSQQGTAFERMMRTYLQTDPLYSDRFEKVFSWMEWPDRPTRERDTGIDLVGIERGRELYGEVAASLDQLETVLAGLDAGRVATEVPALRIGCSAEYFSTEVVGRIATSGLRLVARLEDDGALLTDLERGELDVAITSTTPPRRAFGSAPISEKRFLLVGAPDCAPPAALSSTRALGDWLVDKPWAVYSLEFPITRRFWQTQLGRPFAADLRLYPNIMMHIYQDLYLPESAKK